MRRLVLALASCGAALVPSGGGGGGGALVRSQSAYARDGILLLRDFLAPDELAAVLDDCRKLRASLKLERSSIAVGRLGRVLDSRSAAHRCLSSDALAQRVNQRVGAPDGGGAPPVALRPSEFPIELRVYRPGAGMEWHRDDLLYDRPQCEMVLCLDNTSDSHTEWVDADGRLHSEWTPPNSALLVRAGESGARHRVQTLRRGERTILKMVWAPEGAERAEAFDSHLDSLHGLRAKQASRARGGGGGSGGGGRHGGWVQNQKRRAARGRKR
jgi:hypothetical protein